jgi:GT2 family glycosyltransferase
MRESAAMTYMPSITGERWEMLIVGAVVMRAVCANLRTNLVSYLPRARQHSCRPMACALLAARSMLLIFASRNGASRRLPAMIESLRAMKWRDGLEIIVVDSASTDATGDLLRSSGLPMTVLSVDQTGKNRAVNAALDHAADRLSGEDLVVFTDDDVLVDPEWLNVLSEAADRVPEADIFGGRIEPVFPRAPDDALQMLEDQFDVLFARSVREEGSCRAVDVFGPNMAIRARWFAEGVRFDVGMGPDGGRSFPMGSETELLRRLEGLGAKSWHVAQASVGHMISSEEMSEEAVVQRARRHGAGFAKMLHSQEVRRRVAGVPLWLLRDYLLHTASLALASLSGDQGTRLKARYEYAWRAGALGALARWAHRTYVP